MLLICSKGFFLKKKKVDPYLMHQNRKVCGFFVKHFNKGFSFLRGPCRTRTGIGFRVGVFHFNQGLAFQLLMHVDAHAQIHTPNFENLILNTQQVSE